MKRGMTKRRQKERSRTARCMIRAFRKALASPVPEFSGVGPPGEPDGKQGATSPKAAPELRSTTSEPTHPAGCRQIPVMTQEEAVAFASRVWQQMLKLPNGRRNLAEFIALGALDPQAMAQGIFETGAAHALLTAMHGPPEDAPPGDN